MILKSKKTISICLMCLLFLNVFNASAFAKSEKGDFEDKLMKEYNKYIEMVKTAKTGTEQDKVRKDFYKSIGAKVKKKTVLEFRKNRDGKYELINSYETKGEETDIYSTNLYSLSKYQPGDMRLIMTDSPLASGFSDQVETPYFLNLVGASIEIVVGKYAPAIGVATTMMNAVATRSAPYYNTKNLVSTSNDKILYTKFIEVYTSSGDWYAYAESSRVDTDSFAIHKYYDGVRWTKNVSDYFYDMKIEEGENYNNNSFLYDMAYSRWQSNGSMYSEAYYSGPVFYDQDKLNEFDSWADKY